MVGLLQLPHVYQQWDAAERIGGAIRRPVFLLFPPAWEFLLAEYVAPLLAFFNPRSQFLE